MKRFLFLSMLVFIIVMIWVSFHDKEDNLNVPQKLERAMKFARMNDYHDNDYDYKVRYPSFFEQTEDSLMDKGCCRFTFWQDSTEIVQTSFVVPNPDMLSIEQGMKKYADELYASHQEKGNDYFILSGTLHTDSGMIAGRRFYTKFVQHRKLWFVQSLTYPEDCEHAIQRLIQEVNDWKVW